MVVVVTGSDVLVEEVVRPVVVETGVEMVVVDSGAPLELQAASIRSAAEATPTRLGDQLGSPDPFDRRRGFTGQLPVPSSPANSTHLANGVSEQTRAIISPPVSPFRRYGAPKPGKRDNPVISMSWTLQPAMKLPGLVATEVAMPERSHSTLSAECQ
ncbi:MAG: hypothetical protein WD156_09965 [Acidimicrobiia bacterium]